MHCFLCAQEGAPIQALCEALRRQQAVGKLCGLVSHPTSIIHQASLMLLATVTSIQVDPMADMTTQLIKQASSLPAIVAHLFSNVALTVAYACATIQNTCFDVEVVDMLRTLGAIDVSAFPCIRFSLAAISLH
jgi:hypothetical protein